MPPRTAAWSKKPRSGQPRSITFDLVHESALARHTALEHGAGERIKNERTAHHRSEPDMDGKQRGEHGTQDRGAPVDAPDPRDKCRRLSREALEAEGKRHTHEESQGRDKKNGDRDARLFRPKQ